MRRTTSLSTWIPNANAICSAMRGHPQFGFRRFISTTVSTSSLVGPLGPGRWLRFGENSSRHFLVSSTVCRFGRVEGLKTMVERRRRARRINNVQKPAIRRSREQRFGARSRPRFKIRSWCHNSTDSTTTLCSPPGFTSRAAVTNKCTKRTRKSRIPLILASGQPLHLE